MFSMQAVAHVLIGMLAPVGFALGGPLTLLRGPGSARNGAATLPGAADWLDTLLSLPAARLFAQPVIAGAIFAVAPFAFFFSPAFDLSVRYHWAHLAADVVFLTIGYAFAWAMVGVDPLPRPVSPLSRLGVLLAVMPSCVLLGAAMLGTGRILGDGAASANLYSALALPWVPSLSADQRLGGYLTLASAEAVLLLFLVVVVVRWVGAGDPDSRDYQALVDDVDRLRSGVRPEAAQPQAVEHHEQRRGGHGGAGDERVEQAGRGDG
jgi:putative copper resistance protein D